MSKKIIGTVRCNRCGDTVTIRNENLSKEEKRHPNSNGVLPLTEKELKEYKEKFKPFDFNGKFIGIRIDTEGDCCEVFKHDYTRDENGYKIAKTKAILYLANLFELEVK